MNTELTEENYQALSRYRQERAHETISEIPFLCEQGYYNTAINRLYYACYYAAEALLLQNHISASTHAGVKSMLGLHFVSKGILSLDDGKTFNTLLEKRHSSDYEAFAYCDKELIDSLTPRADIFIADIKELLKRG